MTLLDQDKISWQQLLTVDQNSGEFLELATSLLTSEKHKKFNVSRFSRKEATQLVDVVDIGVVQNESLPKNLRSVAFGILRRISGKFRKLPQSYLIEEGISTDGEIPYSTRGISTLWTGRLDGNRVAIKMLRLGPEDNKVNIATRFCKEVLLWPRLRHPNVLPVCGFSISAFPLGIISPWMENGNILDYTRKHPAVNRMSLLVDVAHGLQYLHKVGQVHGNIRGANVLISNHNPPRARLADFGLNAIMFDVFSMTKASVNWTAPEIFDSGGRDFKPTFASDIYALGMLIYEVLTGRSPFYYKRTKAEVAFQVTKRNKRPLRPQGSERLGITDSVWDNMTTCWDGEISTRLQIESVTKCLTQAAETWVADTPAFLLASEAGIAHVMSLKGEEAQDFIDKFHQTLNSTEISSSSGKTYLTWLKAVCEATGMLPTQFILPGKIEGLEIGPVSSSNTAIVYRATHKGRKIAVKTLKIHKKQLPDSVHKRLVKEVVGWGWLKHENILPFIGISTQPTQFSMVSEWMPNGDIMSFIAQNPSRNRFPLLIDTAAGLRYLHRNDFVHGNLRGANILVDSDFRARLANFSRTRIVDDDAMEYQTKPPTELERDETIGQARESIPWSAPEIIDPDQYGFTKKSFSKLPSKSTDVYAFAMTIFEVLTGNQPFGKYPDGSVVKKVTDRIRPERPNAGFSDKLWNLLQLSWSEEYENSKPKRPLVTLISEQLQRDSSGWFSGARLPFPSVDPSPPPPKSKKSKAMPTETTPASEQDLRDLLTDLGNSLHAVAI